MCFKRESNPRLVPAHLMRDVLQVRSFTTSLTALFDGSMGNFIVFIRIDGLGLFFALDLVDGEGEARVCSRRCAPQAAPEQTNHARKDCRDEGTSDESETIVDAKPTSITRPSKSISFYSRARNAESELKDFHCLYILHQPATILGAESE
ncbi:hypothetical protein IQ07DRAFT_183796 [Pyrenochaeta sp. DS3sAY3a]|nr:hypothetical protein IQ07DRAFT_183796 [Pyrenochaeta sp. DS3sAY3a]